MIVRLRSLLPTPFTTWWKSAVERLIVCMPFVSRLLTKIYSNTLS